VELINLKKQIQNYEKMIYKINNDKEILETQIANLQTQTSNRNIINPKNNRLINSPKAKISYTQTNTMTNNNNQIYMNQMMLLEKNNKKLSQTNIELENQNKYLQKVNQKMFVDLKNKDKYIISLKDKITAFNNEYNKQINSFSKDNDQKQSYIEQLFFERDQLMKENNELKEKINQLNYKIKDFSLMNNQYKLEYNDKIKEMYDNKLNEYKQKIIILKQRINELLGIETHENYFYSRGNSARFGIQNINKNIMKKNRSFKYSKNMNILTDFNFYNEKIKPANDYRKIYANLNFETK
jgi:chromosome segregation ATPase